MRKPNRCYLIWWSSFITSIASLLLLFVFIFSFFNRRFSNYDFFFRFQLEEIFSFILRVLFLSSLQFVLCSFSVKNKFEDAHACAYSFIRLKTRLDLSVPGRKKCRAVDKFLNWNPKNNLQWKMCFIFIIVTNIFLTAAQHQAVFSFLHFKMLNGIIPSRQPAKS